MDKLGTRAFRLMSDHDSCCEKFASSFLPELGVIRVPSGLCVLDASSKDHGHRGRENGRSRSTRSGVLALRLTLSPKKTCNDE